MDISGFPRTAIEFDERFGSEEACRSYLMKVRWPNGFVCPGCGCERGWKLQSRPVIECVLGGVNRPKLQQALQLPSRYSILYALALGRPAEHVRLETVGPEGDIRYWMDPAGVHHVPKRALDELIVEL